MFSPKVRTRLYNVPPCARFFLLLILQELACLSINGSPLRVMRFGRSPIVHFANRPHGTPSVRLTGLGYRDGAHKKLPQVFQEIQWAVLFGRRRIFITLTTSVAFQNGPHSPSGGCGPCPDSLLR